MASRDAGVAAMLFRRVTQRQRWKREDHLLGIAFVLFAGVVLVDMVGLDTGLLRPVIVVPFLSLFPGYLILGLFGVKIRDTTTGVLYSLGLSLCFLMGYGLSLNTGLPMVGFEAVFTERVLLGSLFLGIGILFGAHVRRTDVREVDFSEIVETVWQPWPLALLCVPFFAILGARLVTRSGNNSLILLVLAGLGLLATLGYFGILPERFFPIAIWVIAVSLLLHNSVLTHVIAWDAPKELRLATIVVENGVWDPSVGGKWMKNAMLRIVLLHPIYALLADIDLLWEFKTVSPILFSFTPVAFYKAYLSVVNRQEAFLAALLPMSFFSFFTVLSWNSRTSGALLFLSLVALTLTDRVLSRRIQRILAVTFLFGIVISHYAMAYILIAAMGIVLAGNWVLFGVKTTNRRALTTPIIFLLFGLIAFVWYTYIVYQAGAFTRPVAEVYELSSSLLGTSSAEDSATSQYVSTTYTSDTIRWLQSLNLVLGALAGVSIGAIGLRCLWTRHQKGNFPREPGEERVRVEYFLYAAALLGVFGTTFVGVSQLNTARTLMPALLFFSPFVVLTIRGGGDLVADQLDLSTVRRVAKVVILVFVLSYFVLNVGLYGSATEEYHPNILIDKGQVIEDGSLAEKKYFWAMYYDSIYDLRALEWLEAGDRGGEAYHRYGSRQVISGMYNCTNVSREPIVRQGSCDDGPIEPVNQMDKVYATDGSHIFYDHSVTGTVD